MSSILKSSLLSLALVAGTTIAAQAQSVATLPPDNNAPQTAVTQPYGSTQSYFPKPGGSVLIKEPRSQAGGYAASAAPPPTPAPVVQPAEAPSSHPYSAHIGPKTE